MKKKFKENLDKLFQINQQLNSLLKSDKISPDSSSEGFCEFKDEIKKLLKQKNSCIERLQACKKADEQTFSELKAIEFSEVWQGLQELENENLSLMKNGQTAISKEMSGALKHSKAVASYKFTKDVKPKLFDDEF